MKTIKTIILALIISTSVQANFFDEAYDWASGAVDSVEDFLNPCDAIHGCRFGWDDVPDDWRERKDRSGHF
ncbi:hypothetical protein [uncultured Gammaproteobacteria bacterium]|jgi:hypothetical protein|nr:hypothetical protein [uncultured Gammaproteobacteria bacterium]